MMRALDPTLPRGARLGTGRDPDAASPELARVYLRRYAVQRRRPRYGALALMLLALGALLFARVWESTVAHALSVERDRLRRDVRGLENRIRLTSELGQQAALRGIDPHTLESRGFIPPDPARIIEIDLDQPVPRAHARGGVAARLGAWWKRVRTGPGDPPRRSGAEPVPVRAQVVP